LVDYADGLDRTDGLPYQFSYGGSKRDSIFPDCRFSLGGGLSERRPGSDRVLPQLEME